MVTETFSFITALLGIGDNDVPQSRFTFPGRVFIFDQATESVSRITPNADESFGSNPRISADGQFVAFDTIALDIVPNAFNNNRHVVIYDRAADNFERLAMGIESEVAGGNDDYQC